jgi:8-oxo-dGTP pyrophosphatase MutT (NUDIX family)
VSTASDISWSGPAGTFNLRVAAIITRDDQILVCTVDGLGYWFLPGGRVRFGEPSDVALARELAEELGHDLPPGPLALVVENIFRKPSLEHEIGLYHRITWPSTLAPDDLEAGTESGHRFRWMPVRDLGSVDFRPVGLIPVLPELAGTLQHVVLNGLDRMTP